MRYAKFLWIPIVVALTASTAQSAEYNWRMAAMDTETSIYVADMATPFAKLVEKMSGGKMKIQVLPAGVVAPIFKIHQAVADGLVELGHTHPVFLGKKDPTNAMIGGFPTGLGMDSFLGWLYKGGGKELWEQHRHETMGMHPLLMGFSVTEVFAHSHVPIQKLEDLKGLKYRTLGNWGAIVKEYFGASPTVISSSELYGMLDKKALDLAEYSSPYHHMQLGFHEVAKYIIYPGIHSPCGVYELVMKKERWDALPDDIKTIMEMASRLVTHDSLLTLVDRDLDAMAKWEQGSNVFIKLPQKFKDRSREAARDWAQKVAAKAKAAGNQWPEKLVKSIFAYQDRWRKNSKYLVYDYQQ